MSSDGDRAQATPTHPWVAHTGITTHHLVVGALLGVSVALVFMGDWYQWWADEAIAHRLVDRWNVWEILTVLPRHQPHYPTWYLLPELAGWKLTHLVSIACAPLTVLGTLRIAQALEYPRQNQYLAASLVATSPFLAVQFGWMRMYALLILASTYSVAFALERAHARAGAASVAAALLHPFGVLPAVYVAANALVERAYTTTTLTGVFAGTPLLAFLWVNVVEPDGGGVTGSATGMTHGVVPDAFLVGLTPGAALTGSPHTLLQVFGCVVLFGALVLPGRSTHRLHAWIALPVVAIAGASWVVLPVFTLKYFGFIGPSVAVVLAGLYEDRVPWRRIAIAVTLALFAIGWMQRFAPMLITRRFLFW